ncbi:MAG: hypothetical protein ACLFN6_05445 [Desulfonatronovibrio sp.]
MTDLFKSKPAGDGPPSPASLTSRWLRLLLAAFLIILAIYLAPNLERIPYLGDRMITLRESGIDVGAWYYDDVEEYFEAERYIREKRGLDYPEN